jgi:hypothetical protein
MANGVRQWYIQATASGTFRFVDASAGIETANIGNGNGQWSFIYPCTMASTLQVNSNCTVSGNFATNAISCSTINTNGNVITAAGINCSGQSSMGAGGIIYTTWSATKAYGFSNSSNILTYYVNQSAQGVWNFNVPSDERIKKNIADAEGDALAELCRVKLISFDHATSMVDPEFQPMHLAFGFSAQQMREVIPEAVNRSEWHNNPNGEPSPIDDGIILVLDPMPLLARLVGAVQQLNAKIKVLEGGRI